MEGGRGGEEGGEGRGRLQTEVIDRHIQRLVSEIPQLLHLWNSKSKQKEESNHPDISRLCARCGRTSS